MDERSRIEELVGAVEEKATGRALDPSPAQDYVTLACGLRLYKPTLPHVWAIARASMLFKGRSYGLNVVTAWLLGHGQKEVRNELLALLRKGDCDALESAAEEFLLDAGCAPNEVLPVVAELTAEAFGSKKKGMQDT